jgi:hypothetical protein
MLILSYPEIIEGFLRGPVLYIGYLGNGRYDACFLLEFLSFTICIAGFYPESRWTGLSLEPA